jgi:hypothetical protein
LAQTDASFAFDDDSWHACDPLEAHWEVALEAPVNRVLPVARAHLKRLWAAFGEA